jgi:zinc protease
MPAVRHHCVGAFAALVLAACAPVTAPKNAVNDLPPPRRHAFANGARVVVQEVRGTDLVAVQLWVKAGGRDETSADLGLAHYLEHMVFKGTPTRAPGFVDGEVERVGGRINAATSFDYTYYHAVLPGVRAIPAIEMLADIAVNASLDDTLLDTEKRVVLEEMRLHEDNPRRFLVERLWPLVFDGHPYGRPLIGRPERIRALTSDTLRSFYRRYYVPESFVLVVVGPVDATRVIAAAADTFGRLPRSASGRLPAAAFQPSTPQRREITRSGAHAYLGMAWLAPRLDHADAAALELLAAILGRSRSSRLTRSLRERLAIVNTIGSSYTALEAAGIVAVTAQIDPSNVGRAEAEVLREIRRLRDENVSEAELRRAVTSAESAHEFSLETVDGRAVALGRAETIWRVEDELAWVDRLRAVTVGQIRVVARRYLDPERYARLVVRPPL